MEITLKYWNRYPNVLFQAPRAGHNEVEQPADVDLSRKMPY